jgi:hypothetical protein
VDLGWAAGVGGVSVAVAMGSPVSVSTESIAGGREMSGGFNGFNEIERSDHALEIRMTKFEIRINDEARMMKKSEED